MPERDRLVEGYAEALFAVAEAEASLDQVADEVFRFSRALDNEGDLREALIDPALPDDRKKAVLNQLLGNRANRVTLSLLSFLVEQRRMKDLPAIADALAERAAQGNRRTVAEVRTAVPLDDTHRDRLAGALATATGREVDLKVLVDPTVIGGVMARVGDQVFDGTIRRKLELAREQLTRL